MVRMIKPYVVSMESPRGIAAVSYEAANDTDAFRAAAHIVRHRIRDLVPRSVVEIIRPDATAIDRRPRAISMARFAGRGGAS